VGYHVGTLSTHNNAFVAWGLGVYGPRAEVVRSWVVSSALLVWHVQPSFP
jgi:hypothetical protein